MRYCYHPSTNREIALAFPLENFKDEKSRSAKRAEVTKRMINKGWLHDIGTYSSGRGRPLQVVCTWLLRADRIQHEYPLTRVIAAYGIWDALRGKDVDVDLRPDAELGVFHFEYHTGTMKKRDQVRRLQAYEDSCKEAVVLFVCKTVESMIEVRDWASFMTTEIYFTTVEKVVSQPLANDTWINLRGEEVSVGKRLTKPL